jgi:hypothetical protein
MRWTLNEFFTELERDTERRVLFLEGPRDLAFWHQVVPIIERGDTAIYSISAVECDNVPGGERGRLIWFAQQVALSAYAERILFFADADTSVLLGQAVPANVILTDGRDLECYGYNAPCMEHINHVAFGRPPGGGAAVLSYIEAIARPLGLLRLGAARTKCRLPFQNGFDEGNFKRCATFRAGVASIDLNRTANTLLANARRREIEEVEGVTAADLVALVDGEGATHAATASVMLLHGKDIIAALAVVYDVGCDEMGRHLFSAIVYHLPTIRHQPNLAQAEQWVRAA